MTTANETLLRECCEWMLNAFAVTEDAPDAKRKELCERIDRALQSAQRAVPGREPVQAMVSAARKYVQSKPRAWSYRGLWRAMYDAAPEAPLQGQSAGWRCFHCDDVFTDLDAAREHFGSSEMDTPGCKLNATEGGLLALLRKALEELRESRSEDSASYREFHSLGAKHSVELRNEEQRGYDRGLADGRKEALEATPSPAGQQGEAMEAFWPLLHWTTRNTVDGVKGDQLKALPDSHGFEVVWTSDETGACDFTAGQVRRALAALRASAHPTPPICNCGAGSAPPFQHHNDCPVTQKAMMELPPAPAAPWPRGRGR